MLLGGLWLGMAVSASGPLLGQTVAAHPRADRAWSAQSVLSRQIAVTLHRISLAQALDSLAHIANVLVQYQESDVGAYRAPVSIDVAQAPLGVVLERVLSGTRLRVVPAGDGDLAIVPTDLGMTDSLPASGTISGRVVDSATGRGLSAVTIKIAGTKMAATTQDSGRFTLRDVPAGTYVLTARVFGYRPGERTVDIAARQQSVVRFALAAVPNVLSGVVTTATGQQRKLEVGNDITTLNVDSIRQVAPITSVTDLLESRVPGLTVLHSSGTPGAPARLRLRGAGSLSGNNDPIMVVDGVRVYAAQSDTRNSNGARGATGFSAPSPIDQIDPASIETIEVLKGPSASSLYGSDAANGVIVITTKKGRAGPTHWDIGLGTGLNYEPGDWPVNYFRFGWGQSSNGTAFCAWNDLTCTVDSLVPFQALNNSRYTVFADHGSDQTANLTVSGGVPNLLYSFTGSGSYTLGVLKLPDVEQTRYEKFYQQDAPKWMLRPDNYTTYSGSGQVTARPAAALQLTVGTSLFSSHQQQSSLQSGIAQLEQQYVFADQLDQNPLITGEFQRVTDAQLSWTNNVSMNWQPASWLPINTTAGLNSMARTDESLVPYGINPVSTDAALSSPLDTMGSYGLGRGNVLVKTLTAYTNLPVLGRRMTAAVGGNVQSQSTADLSAATILSPGVNSPSLFPTTPSNASSFSQSKQSESTYGWFVEPRLNVLSRFFVSPGFRLDGGSASGSRAGLTGFPKINLSYVTIDREGEEPVGGILTLFRPRLAYGYAGVQPGPSDRLRLLQPGCNGLCNGVTGTNQFTLDGNTYITPLTLTTLGNTVLRPERSSELEGGFDTELWRGRLSLTATRYDKVRHDAIISLPVAPSVVGTGYSQLVNIGVVRNTGTELSATAQVFESQAIGWNLLAQWSHNANRLVRINDGFTPRILDDGTGIVPGYPLFGRWALPIVAYADANHDDVIEPDEVQLGDSKVYVGASDPSYELSLNSTVVLGGRLSVTANVSYENGLNQFNSAGLATLTFLANRPGMSLATQAAIIAAGGYNKPTWGQLGNGLSDIGLMQTVSTLRFNSLSVNYSMPTGVAQWFRVPRMSVALQGSNLGLHSNYRGKDPNVNAFSVAGPNGDQVQDSGQLPQPRTWWLRVTLGN